MTQIHIDLIQLLALAEEHGLSEELLLSDLRRGRHRKLTLPELQSAVRDLADKSLVTTFHAPLSGRRWRITELGRSKLKEEGL